MNWRQLKEFCINLPEQELDKKVILWREDEAITAIEAMQLEEDHYLDPEDEMGCFLESTAKSFIEDVDAYPDGMDSFKKVYDKGNPILWEEF